jgi:uncharacterized RDD family membrane protein YckC
MAPAAESAPREEQQPLFGTERCDNRIIPFESLTSHAERQSIRARAAGLSRPEPVKSAKVEVRHARGKRQFAESQGHLDFIGQQDVSLPQSDIICDAPVAPPLLRLQAALIDGALMVLACLIPLGIYRYSGGTFGLDRRESLVLSAALMTVPLFYQILWAVAGRDSIGMRAAGLELIDFDGNPPSLERRWYRFAGGWISRLAAGIGLIWSLVDQDGLAWHDHISGTFPTIRQQ